MAFPSRTVTRSPRSHSLYTVAVESCRRSATCRTESSMRRSWPTRFEGAPPRSTGVANSLRSDETGWTGWTCDVAPPALFGAGCDSLVLAGLDCCRPVTPEATGSSPVHPATYRTDGGASCEHVLRHRAQSGPQLRSHADPASGELRTEYTSHTKSPAGREARPAGAVAPPSAPEGSPHSSSDGLNGFGRTSDQRRQFMRRGG